MSKNVKRLLSFLLVVVLAVGVLLAGCGNKNSSSSSSNTSKQEQTATNSKDPQNLHFKSDKPLEFTMLYSDHPNYPYKSDWLLWKAIKDATNVTLKLTIVPMSDYSQKRSLLISSGQAPEIIPKTYPGQEIPFVSSGAILPVSDYIDQMPNFSREIKEWGLQNDINSLKQADGKFYVLPLLHQTYTMQYSLAIRQDIFEKNNIPIPNTWDELESALKKLKELYPNSIPMSDRWQGKALIGEALPTFGVPIAGSDGLFDWTQTSTVLYNSSKDDWEFYPTSQEYKDMLTYFNRLVKEGLLDPASFTQTDDQAVQKFVTGKSFVIMTNTQEIQNMINRMNETLGQGNFKVTQILPLAGPKGGVIAGSRLENGIMISAKAKDDPNFPQLLKFVDWLWYSEAGETLTKWGVEGVTYQKVNGKFQFMPDVDYMNLNPSGTKNLQKDYGFAGGVFTLIYGGPKDLAESMMTPEVANFENQVNTQRKLLPVAPPVPFTESQREQANMLSQPIGDYVEQMMLKFITGVASIDKDWNSYVQQVNSKGVDQLVKLTNDVYQSSKAKMK
ncbi:sugar ABC transporter substrate-binding protein [Thermoanaerobacterium thermosaccharolyticum]|uniref:Sugar ABC transporter substrate-binding protein n=2 Tax=Thermoanaerobacterium thermosaccharolyticum TaxID=1517 RepID=A0A231VMR6_THETR|nr:extracellular solute-binding protein [Thermoanaerobacterium thermosaccharolyticum]AGB18600.1 carbohydrate ABC transporter substrate-binding protein, CUT1 family [Thermoanaerobacterium thermosaccharolyticum M0795]AST58594.1 sugar ABC transporter substrate-binding protein [Thermoanaerobacterium thermosaccharolyticum]OXT09565.1 sugar ABC transporter substrate-binding protein [Thermoanaerobacterium thermosaccharolyticum]PHO07862.1 sugar ABC transporter substrate-binding protein [Thermoanaerobact